MTQLQTPITVAEFQPWRLERRAVLLLWLASGLLLLAVAYFTPLERTQEARVLVGAREMLGRPVADWVLPHVNGRLRLQKPPLAYWASAASMWVFGVSTLAGRVPMVLASWLTIGLVFVIGRQVLNARSGFFAAGALAGSFFLLRYGRLAETDVLALPFLTLAVYGFWRGTGFQPVGHGQDAHATWFHVSSICIGIAANAKGLSAALPLVFFIGWVCVERRWGAIWRWMRCGAPLTLAAVALPWWIYVVVGPHAKVFWQEVHDVTTGRDHGKPPWLPLGYTLEATLPWVGFVLLAIAAAVPKIRASESLRGLLVWSASILVPLMILPQKQEHYILPILPPLMVLVGWLMDRGAAGDDRPLTRATVWILGATTVVGLVGAAAPPVKAWIGLKSIRAIDWIMALAILLGMLRLIVAYHRRGLLPACGGAVVIGALLMAAATAVWAPTLDLRGMGPLARHIQRKYGDARYVFYPIENLPLSFEMREAIPTCPRPEDVAELLAKHERIVVISEEDDAPVALLPGANNVIEYPMKKKVIRAYELSE